MRSPTEDAFVIYLRNYVLLFLSRNTFSLGYLGDFVYVLVHCDIIYINPKVAEFQRKIFA